MLNHPAGLFSGDYNSALRGCWPLKFLHILQLPEMYFKSYLGLRAASVLLCPIFLVFLFFNQTQDLRAPSADRLETVISICVNFLMQVQKLGRSSPKKIFYPR